MGMARKPLKPEIDNGRSINEILPVGEGEEKAAPNNCSKFRQLCLAVANDEAGEVGGSRLWNSSPLASFHHLQEESREKLRAKVPGTAAPKQ